MATAISEGLIAASTRSFLARKPQILIDGKWRANSNGESLPVIDPATGAKIGEIAAGNATDIDLAVESSSAAFTGAWSKFTAAERTKAMWRLADLIEKNARLVSELEILDAGMTHFVGNLTVQFSQEILRYYAGWPTKIHGKTIPAAPQGRRPGEFLTYTLREPIGVVGAITPWNFPLGITMLKVAPILATGCTLVLKPAELASQTALLLGELALEAGFPPGVINVVPGLGEIAGAALSAHAKVQKVAFTGSSEVGKLVVKAAAGDLKKVSLELGGKSPMIVFADADVEALIPQVANACFYCQGQNCMAGTRLFVHEKIHDRVVAGLAAYSATYKIGPGMDPSNTMGPLISAEQRDRVLTYIDSGKKAGAELVVGGKALARSGFFIEPTVFSRASDTMDIVNNEIFGPVLAVEVFGDENLDDLARRANSTVYGLSGSVWTRDLGIAHRMVRKIDAGQVSINCHAAVDPPIPFGGNKQSGWGREFGEEGLDLYLKTKAVTAVW